MEKSITANGWKTIYNIKFADLTDLYNYLKSNPKVNRKVLGKQVSLSDNVFYGETLEKATEYCINGLPEKMKKEKDEQMSDGAQIVNILSGNDHVEKAHNNNPQNQSNNTSSIKNIYFNLGYPAKTDSAALMNRGLATLYLAQALEKKGELGKIHGFTLNKNIECNEIINIEMELKKASDSLDIEKNYFPMTQKEFLRRLLFRVLESTEVKNKKWYWTYGLMVEESKIGDFYNISSNDLIVLDPKKMDIKGENIYADTAAFIEKLGLKEEFDVAKLRSEGIKKKTKL